MSLLSFAVNIFFILKNISGYLSKTREKTIAKLLLNCNLSLSAAESCTGGLIISRMTDIAGSSSFINQSFVTYSNEAKIKLLGVNIKTIEKYGIVSEEVALEMAKGLLNNYNCSIAVSTTGLAGPSCVDDERPVGTVCIAIASNKTYKTYTFRLNSILFRRVMKYAFSDKALNCLLEFLQNERK